MINYQPIFGGWTFPVMNQQENLIFIQNSIPTNTFVQNSWENYSMWNQYIQTMLSCPTSPYTADSS